MKKSRCPASRETLKTLEFRYTGKMIGQISGSLIFKGERFVIVSAGGVGYKVFTTPDNIRLAGGNSGDFTLWTHLVVKEDALDLYGFATQDELALFEILLTVSGIGPKSALQVLSLAGSETLRKAVTSANSEYLTKISGIGKKIAEKIVLELKDKILALGPATGVADSDYETDTLSALQALGYSLKEAREAVKKIPADITDTGEKIKVALKQLGSSAH